MQTQLIISFVSIGSAAAVALACDFLRARNGQLREELREQRRLQAQKAAKPVPRHTARLERAARRSDRILPREILPREDAAPQAAPAQPTPPKPNPVLTTWLIERAVERAARKTEADPIPEVPPGMHPFAALSQLVETRQPFTGLVIAIGVTGCDELGLAVEQFIARLLRSSDFGCRVDAGEFLLLCPGPGAAEAQRHLSHISEQLWEYQLRGLGKSPLVFNMGGTDVHGESLSEAISSAQERMNQTRRGSKAATALNLVPR